MKLRESTIALSFFLAAGAASAFAEEEIAVDDMWRAQTNNPGYYVADTAIRQTNFATGVLKPNIAVGVETRTDGSMGCPDTSVVYVRDADYDLYEQVTPDLVKEIEERRQTMNLINMAKARNFSVRLVISDREEDMIMATNGDYRCRIVRVSVR